MNDQLQTAKDWLGDLSKIVSRQKTKEDYEYAKKRTEALGYLINRVEELKNRCTEIAAESTAQEEKLLKENQRLEKRVEELEKENEKLKRKLKTSRESVVPLSEEKDEFEYQNIRYKQALEFYADENNYDYKVEPDSVGDVDDETFMVIYEVDSEIITDGGYKARQALKGESNAQP